MKKITPKEAKDLNQNFVETRSAAIDTAIGKKDSISTWFSLESLKNYITYIENEASIKEITIDGLRVYFGAYSKNDNNPSKNNYSTVFFVPTQSKKGTSLENEDAATAKSIDITSMDALNDGQTGNPPSAEYPQ